MEVKEQKNRLRERLLEKRESLPESHYRQASEEIVMRLQTLSSFQSSRTINCYVSINQRREVNTHSLIRWLLASNKRVVVPVTDFETTRLQQVELQSFSDLEPNKWGVLEPNKGRNLDPDQLDFVVVPMVGGDPDCNRLGYGKGFYDRFLAETECPAVGLCFEECIVENIPTESFDMQLTAIITEERTIQTDQ